MSSFDFNAEYNTNECCEYVLDNKTDEMILLIALSKRFRKLALLYIVSTSNVSEFKL